VVRAAVHGRAPALALDVTAQSHWSSPAQGKHAGALGTGRGLRAEAREFAISEGGPVALRGGFAELACRGWPSSGSAAGEGFELTEVAFVWQPVGQVPDGEEQMAGGQQRGLVVLIAGG
jgi:hypothetical protein